jgi:hypothetical protein
VSFADLLIGISSDKHVRHVIFFCEGATGGAANKAEKKPVGFLAPLFGTECFSALPFEDLSAAIMFFFEESLFASALTVLFVLFRGRS